MKSTPERKKKKQNHNQEEPTEEEIAQTKKLAKDKFGIEVPKKDVCKLVKIMKKLQWWFKLPEEPMSFNKNELEDLGSLFKKHYGKELTTTEKYDFARGLSVLVLLKEKQRLADEVRAILVKNKIVKYEPILLEKLSKLFQLNCNIELNKHQLYQILFYLSKGVWYEEGLDETVEKCLDDLLVYFDKRKRGKRLNTAKHHDEVRKILDWAVKEFKLTFKKYDLFYREDEGVRWWKTKNGWVGGSISSYKEDLKAGKVIK